MPQTLLRFSTFCLDRERMLLSAAERQIQLRPKSFETLVLLLEKAGRVVTKDELMQAIWPDVIVTEDSLTRCISDIRRALGKDGHLIIKTVAKRGYVLDSIVEELAARAASEPPRPVSSNQPDAVVRPAPASLLGALKPITVLHCRLTKGLEPIATEDAERALAAFEYTLSTIKIVVERYGGFIHTTTSEEAVALFGALQAHEDDALRCCAAAMQLCELTRLSDGAVTPQLGIGSGAVVVQPRGERADALQVGGGALYRAARLSHAAEVGTPLMNEETFRLVEGAVQVRKVGGDDSDTTDTAYALLGLRPSRTRFQALVARGLTGFVGRTEELELLSRSLVRARNGKGQLVLVIGDPGVGKSRLLHEFMQLDSTSGWLVLKAASVSFLASSYLPLISLLRGYYQIEGNVDPGEAAQQVIARTVALREDLARDVPALLSLLDLPVEDKGWHELQPAQRRQATHTALRRLVLCEALHRPVLLVIEDLHWIDQETQTFLETLADGLAAARVMIVGTCRPEYSHRWAGRSNYMQLRLNALAPDLTRAMLDQLLGMHPSLDGFKESVTGHGIPLFLEEIVRTMVETRKLTGKRGDYRLQGASGVLRVPSSVQAILAARIDRLQPTERRLLQTASVVGSSIPLPVLQVISGLSEPALENGLTSLREAELLYEARVLPDVEYMFKHALTHEVAYGSLLNQQRQELHERIVDAMERIYADRISENAERLAYHALKGGPHDKAVQYARMAGIKSASRSALHEARHWFEQALERLDHISDDQLKLELGYEIRLELRPVLTILGEISSSHQRLAEAEAIADQLEDDRRRCRVGAFMINANNYLKRFDKAIALGSRTQAIADSLRDLDLQTLTTTFLEQVHFHLANYPLVIELAEQNLARLPPERAREFFGNQSPPAVYDRFWLVESLAQLGRFADAGQIAPSMLEVAESLDHAWTLGLALVATGKLHLFRGDWQRAKPLLDRGVEVTRAGFVDLLVPYTMAPAAWVHAALGNRETADAYANESERIALRQGQAGLIAHRGWYYQCAGRARLLLGQIEDALRLAKSACEASSEQPGYMAWAVHLLADVSFAMSDWSTAERSYLDALLIAERQRMRPLIAHCHRGLACLPTTRKTASRDHSRIAQSHYTSMAMAFEI